MKLTQYTDYALRVLMYVAERPNDLATISQIASHHGISRNHVVKVVHQLSPLGYLKTQRGKNGGLKLAADPCAIGLGRVVRDMEPSMTIAECFGTDPRCLLSPRCALKSVFQQALRAFVSTLDQYSLQDIVAPGGLATGDLILALNQSE